MGTSIIFGFVDKVEAVGAGESLLSADCMRLAYAVRARTISTCYFSGAEQFLGLLAGTSEYDF